MKKEKNEVENVYKLKHIPRHEFGKLLKNNIDTIVGNINRIMIERKISQAALAHSIESEPSHMSYILKQKPANCVTFAPNKGITINVLGRIAAALDMSISELSKPTNTP